MGRTFGIRVAVKWLLIVAIAAMASDIARGNLVKEMMKKYIKTHKQATAFDDEKRALKSFTKRENSYSETKEWLEEWCCDSGEEECGEEERDELRAEAYTSSHVETALCELSVKEGKSCKCTGGRYASGNEKCGKATICSKGMKPCLKNDNTNYCQTDFDTKMCYKESLGCDGNNDCGDWFDENSCPWPTDPTTHAAAQVTMILTAIHESWMDSCCNANCQNYKGTKSMTETGKTCQAWNMQTPHKHVQKEDRFRDGDFETNYCRNPDGSAKAWCYTMENERWEWCDIPKCEASAAYSKQLLTQKMWESKGNKPDYFGDVMAGGRPICAKDWNDVNAKVACKELGFGANTKGIATNYGYFGAQSTNFIISEVNCETTNAKLSDCLFKRRNVCPSGGIAGAVCVDPEQLTLLNKKNQEINQGNVLLHGKYPVCSNNWDKNDARVVCNHFYSDQFSDRENSQVPVFKATVNSDFGQAPSDHFIMANVQCKGDEKWLTDCQASYFPLANDRNRCSKTNAAGVQCARCTVPRLKQIIESIKQNAALSETKQSVRDAFETLKKECHPWECIPGHKQEYPEYCLAYQFLESFTNIIKGDRKTSTDQAQKIRPLSLKFDMSEQIKYLKDDSDAQIIQNSIGKVQEQTAAFQTQLGEYFIQMAKYDEAKNVADFRLAKTIWNRQKQQISALLDKMKPGLDQLFTTAFTSAALNVVDKAAGLFLAIKSAIRPADAVLNPGEFAAVLNDIREAAGAAMDAAASVKGLTLRFVRYLPQFFTLMNELSERFRKNTEESTKMYKILQIDDVSEFTVENATTFLVSYEEFNPSLTTEELARFKSLITDIIDSACDVILAEGSGVGSATIRSMFIDLCPEIKKDRDILIDLVSAIKDSELDLNFNVYAAIARSKLSINEAKKYKRVMGMDTLATIRNAIAGKKAYVLYQLQKVDVINGACDLIRYRNYGVEEGYCKELRKNPNGELRLLLAGLKGSSADMCVQPQQATVNVPARFRRGDQKIPDGTLDLSILFDHPDPSVSFQIPNTQWLVDNGWLEESEATKGPFYLKKFELFLPPWYGKDRKTVHTELALLKNTLEPNGDLYNFDEDVNYVLKYTDYEPSCTNKVDNPYNTAGCKTQGPKPCIKTPGVNNHQKVYPSLMSLWTFHMSLPHAVRKQGVIPFSPSGDFNFKAKVQICYKGSKSGKREFEANEKRWSMEAMCCAEQSKPKVEVGSECQNCTAGAVPRMVGYYCESCPAGYEPRKKERYEHDDQAFGCKPCKPKFFKSSAGNSQCKPCSTTDESQTGATQCLPAS